MRVPFRGTVGCIFSVLSLAAVCSAQRVDLPMEMGGLAPGEAWTVLRPADLAKESRPSDPAGEPARSMLLATLEAVAAGPTAEGHVILHSAGSTGGIRLVDAYSAPGSATSEELRGEAAVDELRKAIAKSIADGGGPEARFAGHSEMAVGGVGGVMLTFEQDLGEQKLRFEQYVVPAGERLQFFQALHFADDAGGHEAIAELIGTFDGAREGRRGLPSWVIGAIAGGIGGLVVALIRKKRVSRTADPA